MSLPSSLPRVLVVEDEQDIREFIVLHLKREGYEVQAVDDGEKAIAALQSGSPDLVILDWMLPSLSGLEVCRSIQGRIPVLMVTARTEPSDIVSGLESGADDYVTKPFEIAVFLARIRALIRRTGSRPAAGLGPKANQQADDLKLAGLVLNESSHEVTCQGEKLALTVSEFKLLAALMRNRGRVLSRDQLIKLVQGEGVTVVDRAIDTHIFGLRKKLGPCAEFVETIRGVGYRIQAE